MRRTLKITAAVLLSAAWALPAPAYAAPAPAPAPAPDDDDTVVIDDDMEDTAPAKPAEDTKADASVDLFGDKGKPVAESAEKGQDGGAESEAQQLKDDKAFISVVQRQRFLKKKRFDIQPHFGITVNDPFVRHYVVGAEFNYWLTNRMAVGLTGSAFIGNKTSRYLNIRAQEGLLLTANKTLWQASANFLYNPFYGKIAVFNRALMHWEAYVQLGGGVIQTQVIPRFEALHEPFRTITGQGNFAVGARFYIPSSDFVSFNIGVRNWVYLDKLEPGQRGPSTGSGGLGDLSELDDPANAKAAADSALAFNTVIFFGVSFYFPTGFEYTTRR
ncbi:MAG: outer membrane beta-barrel domain-containing protein [Nannocystis sp.]|nr:outer membrane beta-barrel domain-containing protein [Nannocystis sp.]